MAEVSSGRTGCHRCDLCGVAFKYPSQLQRHMKSESHCIFAEVCLFDHVAQDDVNSPMVTDDYQVEENQEWDVPGVSEDEVDEATGDVEGMVIQDILSDSMESLSFSDCGEGTSYYPFPNKLHALLYLLLHSPRPLGDSNLKFVLFMLNQCAPTVASPSLSALKTFSLPDYRPPVKFTTSDGVPFHVNTLASILTRCLGNCHTAESLVRYPVKASTFKEMYHARRWLEDPRFQSHTATLPDGNTVFVKDFVYFMHPLHGNVMGKVQHFFQKEGSADIFVSIDILLTPDQLCSALQRAPLPSAPGTTIIFDTCEVPACAILSLAEGLPETLVKWCPLENMCRNVPLEEMEAYLSLNPLRESTCGKPVVTVPIILYSDDMSGNKSKKWHEFNNWCLLLAGLPRHLNSQLANIHLISFSDSVSTLHMAEPIADELLLLENEGLQVFDAHLRQNVHVFAPLLLCICDNPRASELLNHRGSNARKFCRMCMVDRCHDTTALETLRTKSQSLQQITQIRQQRTESEKNILRVEYGLGEHHNPFFSIPADLYRSTPFEALHTVLLGPYKYLLKALMKTLSGEEKRELLARLESFNYSGMESRITGNICQHYKSFVGRDYKALAQIAPFILGPYLSPEQKAVWLALSKVFVICYCAHYSPQDRVHVQSLCNDFVSKAVTVFPELKRKPKIHLFVHLVQCLEDFGPTSGYSAERLESHNGLLRCIHLYGNKLAPSRDVARRMSVIEHIRFVCSGGVFADGTRCGEDLSRLYQSSSVQHFFNSVAMKCLHSSKAIHQPCALRKAKGTAEYNDLLVHRNGHGMVPLTSLTPRFTTEGEDLSSETQLQTYHALVAQDSNVVEIGNYVCCFENEKEFYAELLLCIQTNSGKKLCLLQPLELVQSTQGECVYNDFDCPLLQQEEKVVIIPTKTVLYSVSVVHECSNSCVFAVQSCHRRIERQFIDIDTLTYKHDLTNNLFCLNVYCMPRNNNHHCV